MLRRPRWIRRRSAMAWVVAGLALVGAVFTGIQHHVFNPREPVEQLLRAVAQRDGAAYRSMLAASPYLIDAQKSALVTSPVLREGVLESAAYTPPTNMRAGLVSRGAPRGFKARDDHDIAEVAVSYRLGGEDRHDKVVVYRDRNAWFSNWRLASAGAEAHVDAWHTTSGRYRIASATSTDATGYPVPPGSYVITAEGDAMFTPAETTREVGFTTDIYVDFRTDARDHLKRNIAQRIENWLRGHCVRGKVAAACGFTVAGDGLAARQVPDAARWRIAAFPSIILLERDDEFSQIGPLVVRTTTPGTATTTFTRDDGTTTRLEVAVYARGHLTASSSGVQWHPTSCDIGTPHCPDAFRNLRHKRQYKEDSCRTITLPVNSR